MSSIGGTSTGTSTGAITITVATTSTGTTTSAVQIVRGIVQVYLYELVRYRTYCARSSFH